MATSKKVAQAKRTVAKAARAELSSPLSAVKKNYAFEAVTASSGAVALREIVRPRQTAQNKVLVRVHMGSASIIIVGPRPGPIPRIDVVVNP